MAWILAEGTCHAVGDWPEVRVSYRASLVLERRDDTWLIRQYHGSEPSTTGEDTAT